MKKIFENKVFKIVTGCVKAVLAIVLISYIGLILVQRFSGNKSIMGYRFFTIATASMKGVYDVNDVIIVEDCDTSKLKIGDDVTYIGNRAGLEGKIITHRIIKVEDEKNGGKIFTTQGVAAENEDPPITDSQILGKVSGKLPFITQINHVVRSNVGFFTIVFVPLVLIIVLEILQTITDYQLEKHEIEEIQKGD